MQMQATKTVGELVSANPAAARVFEKFGIDYCCGGNKSFAEACLAAKVSEEDVAAALRSLNPNAMNATGKRRPWLNWRTTSSANIMALRRKKSNGWSR